VHDLLNAVNSLALSHPALCLADGREVGLSVTSGGWWRRGKGVAHLVGCFPVGCMCHLQFGRRLVSAFPATGGQSKSGSVMHGLSFTWVNCALAFS